MSCDGCVALPRGAMSLRFVFVVFSDHTHYFSLAKDEKHLKMKFYLVFLSFSHMVYWFRYGTLLH